MFMLCALVRCAPSAGGVAMKVVVGLKKKEDDANNLSLLKIDFKQVKSSNTIK